MASANSPTTAASETPANATSPAARHDGQTAASTAGHPAIGSDEWLAHRREAWHRNAAVVVADLRKYEDEHPEDAPCFLDLLAEALTRVSSA